MKIDSNIAKILGGGYNINEVKYMEQTVWKKGIIDDFILISQKGKYSVENNHDFIIRQESEALTIYEYKIKEKSEMVIVYGYGPGFGYMTDQDRKGYGLSNIPTTIDGVKYRYQEQFITTLENDPSITFHLYKGSPNNGFALAMFYDPDFRYTDEVEAEIKNLVRWAQREYKKE